MTVPEAERRLRSLEHRSVAATQRGQAIGRLSVPNIIEFVTSPEYLDRPKLYPRQATLLKIMTLSTELLTSYDLAVIAEWEAGFQLTEHDVGQRYEGRAGLAPGTLERMDAARAAGRWWFREVVLVLGRRAGKGYLSALVTAYLLWRVLALECPQRELGLERTKELLVMTMAAGLQQALSNQYRDLAELLDSAPCFAPYVAARTTDSIRLRTPAELAHDPKAAGSVLVQGRPATGTAGRGPAAIALLFDEMAHAPASGLQRGADEIYRGAVPALAQFRRESLILLASSPASRTGEFYAAYSRGLAVTDGELTDPTALVVQLPSWGTYLDWERAHEIPMWPGGPHFAALQRAIIADDEEMRRHARANPDSFRVEFEAQWRSSLAAYLDPDLVHAIFGAHLGRRLEMQSVGIPGVRYAMHCDPSTSGANFAIAIGHLEGGTADGHIVFDHLRAFKPSDFPEARIDYRFIQEHLLALIKAFSPAVVTFDQHNSELLIQNLNAALRQQHRFPHTAVGMRTATASRNWDDAERFKTLMGQLRIHAPSHELALAELIFLECEGVRVDHPRTGPVTTSDVADAMFNVVAHLMDGSANTIAQLSAVPLRAADMKAASALRGWGRPDMGGLRGAREQGHNPARGLYRGPRRQFP
jgi:hypothetical protein